ncbi:hypothetical protein [Methanobrevibacter curvatus]|uniref:Transposase n=1 Tax=Methanobrevibacter curvatus TaxID=49547 RepID=A0A162F9S1_9EURY|nr:hypothetical protein [Methanobrevibacter curvatus]KZX09985.1 hypothetical protein MBCUR_20020 [Methanobrevibacter curvatus]
MVTFNNKCKKTYNKSFISNFNTIFYDLRAYNSIVFLVLKIILKEMSLRGTAEALEVKLDTTVIVENCNRT